MKLLNKYENPQDYREWLASIKVGDKVVERQLKWGDVIVYQATHVKHFTPTGRIVLANGRTYKADGDEYGTGHYGGGKSIHPYTSEVEEYEQKVQLIDEIHKLTDGTSMYSLSLEQLRNIANVLR